MKKTPGEKGDRGNFLIEEDKNFINASITSRN